MFVVVMVLTELFEFVMSALLIEVACVGHHMDIVIT